MLLRGVGAWALALLSLVLAGIGETNPALAQLGQLTAKAEAAGPPLHITVLVGSRKDACYAPGEVAAVTAMVRAEELRINRAGGIAGRPLQVQVLDDERDAARTVANVRQALDDPATLAMIGLSGADRAKAAFEALGKDIGERRIPFLTGISVNSIIAGYPTVFTTQATQDDERLPVMTAFLRHMRFSRPAFVGLADAVFSKALGDGLRRELGEAGLVADHRLTGNQTALDPSGLSAMVADLKEKHPDIVVLGLGGPRAAIVADALVKAGVAPALFVAGRIESLPAEMTASYPNALYQLAWDRLPEADSERLRRMMAKDPPDQWVFEGRKITEAPGWADGKCKERETLPEPDPFTSANLRAIGIGATSADMVALVAASAGTLKAGADTASLRAAVTKALGTTYAAGRGAFKGRFENWSFNPATRAASRTPFVVIQPQGLGRTQLAPLQFVRVRDGSLRRIETVYLDIDLVRAHHVEDNEKTFFAEIYLSMRNGAATGIEAIEFTNAYVDPRTNGRQVTIEQLHDGGPSGVYPEGMKVYKVAGRFTFEPDLANYPFDTQRFSIDLQPKKGDAPFIVQPPPLSLRDRDVATDGWDQKGQYVGTDEDFIPLIDAYTHEPSVVPFYKASFAWLMKRQTTDYYLRVVVPLAFILVVAYLSIFIPISHFEAIVTI
ncbi:MAG: ABC transporter substrate-binding protein, partial [Hyphomicrobiaceae bacterium]